MLGGQALGVQERSESLAGVAALSVRSGDVDLQPDLAFRGEAGGVDGGRHVERFAGVAQVDGDGDRVELDVGRSELGVVVVAVLPQALGRLPGVGQVGSGPRSLSWPAMTASTRCIAP
jgi:hypothetical protein